MIRKYATGWFLYLFSSMFFVSLAFAEFIPPNIYHVKPSDPTYKTINDALDKIRVLPMNNRSSSGYKIYVHNEGTPYVETISMDARFPYVELIGVPDALGNRPIIDGTQGNPTVMNPEEENVINISMLNSAAGAVHGFVIMNGKKTGVKITASDVNLYDNDIRDNNLYGISISFGYGPSETDLDSDGDGVKDPADSCPGTATLASVNRNGCSSSQITNMGGDNDNDGVPLDVDRCPNTSRVPAGAPPLKDPTEVYIPVNVNGCVYGNIHDNDIHDNLEWNINVYSNSWGTEADLLTQPMIQNNRIYTSKVGIAVRSEFGALGAINVKPIILNNSIFDIKGFSGPVAGTIMGGITVTNNGYVKVIGNDIYDMSRGVAFSGGSGVVFNNDIHHTNSLSFGNGVTIGDTSFDILVMNNRIYQNEANGVSFTALRGIEVINNTIDSNGENGIIQGVSGGTIRNNILSFNGGFGYLLNLDTNSTVSYNGFWKNASGDHGGSAKATSNDVYEVPKYVDGTSSTRNYHLLSGSGYIDAGDPSDDCSNEPVDTVNPACRIDMGAYGNTAGATIPSSAANDFDLDDVINLLDRCPGTMPDVNVDVHGCSVDQAGKDDDNDGVVNAKDQCPATPAAVSVDARGCGIDYSADTDSDGVVDPLDRCPGTLAGEAHDSFGCGASQQNDDSDNDGVRDPDDKCKNTFGVSVGSDGCPLVPLTDDDNDGVDDFMDRCIDTPSGETPNVNGCSPSQLGDDTDNDSVFDNDDVCPGTKAGAAVNGLGCPVFLGDNDGDGVKNDKDVCPGTPANEQVSPVGCSVSQGAQDTDQDGVVDDIDICPGTRPGVQVDSLGCEVSYGDVDEDGVFAPYDRCPDTPKGESANPQGCSPSQLLIDTDNDSIPDNLDVCKGTPAGALVEQNGCVVVMGMDSDSDGISDLYDKCDNSDSSFVVDENGCTEAQRDNDSDGDGVTDPLDNCPNTPQNLNVYKTEDRAGCVVNSTDDDGDSVENVFDRCPGTSQGEQANSFGCSESQLAVDTDQDSVLDMFDNCGGTPAGSEIDSVGCINSKTNDSDGDGVVDADDRCANTPSGEPVSAGYNGCSQSQLNIDDDGDKVPNYMDECLNTPVGTIVDSDTGCSKPSLDSMTLSIVNIDTNEVKLSWSLFTGNSSRFKGYYLYRSEDVAPLEGLVSTITSLLVPSTTPQGVLVLCFFVGLGFFLLGKRRAVGTVFFIVLGVGVSAVYIKAAALLPPSSTLYRTGDINQTTYTDTTVEAGKKYYYRLFVLTKDEDVYPSRILTVSIPITSFSTSTVILRVPEDASTNVGVGTLITAKFDSSMDGSSINTNTFTVSEDGGTDVTGTVSYVGGLATFDPASLLLSSTKYNVTIKKDVKDISGDSLEEDITWSFTTGLLALDSAIVDSVSPQDREQDVSIGTSVLVKFANPMDESSISVNSLLLETGNLSVRGSVQYNSGNMTATFSPDDVLLASATYYLTVTTNVRTLSGFTLPFSRVFQFTTGSSQFLQVNVSGNLVPGAWKGSLTDGNNTTYTLDFGVQSADSIGLGPGLGGGQAPGGDPGPGGNSALIITGTVIDNGGISRKIVGSVDYICNETKCDGTNSSTTQYGVKMRANEGNTLVFSGVMNLYGGKWVMGGNSWFTGSPGIFMLNRRWSSYPTQ